MIESRAAQRASTQIDGPPDHHDHLEGTTFSWICAIIRLRIPPSMRGSKGSAGISEYSTCAWDRLPMRLFLRQEVLSLRRAMGAGELFGKRDPIFDLLVHRFLLPGFAGMAEFGVGQDVAERIEQLRLLNGQGAEQRIHDALLG
jgi:hypothetical protein